MKEIKFRAWDTIRQVMVGVDIIATGEEKPYIIVDEKSVWNKDPETGEAECLINMIDCEIMQYTGLKDGSKTEFCEGDILEVDGDWYRVEWEDDYGQWLAVSLFNQGDSMSLGEFHNCTDVFIQGNIYENPELLNI